MTIAPGGEWGRTVPRPADLVVVSGDAALAAALTEQPTRPVAVEGGDLARTLGNRPIADRAELLALPLDLVEFRLDGGATRCAVAHLVVRSPAWAGAWWRGEVLAVMNAEFIGTWDVAPRGHPNDGRVEVFHCPASFGLRQRLAARRRLPTGTHVPHPQITTRSVKQGEWRFRRRRRVYADGVEVGSAMTLEITVLADAVTLHS